MLQALKYYSYLKYHNQISIIEINIKYFKCLMNLKKAGKNNMKQTKANDGLRSNCAYTSLNMNELQTPSKGRIKETA